MLFLLSFALLAIPKVDAHIGAYSRGMYCANGFNNGVKMSGYDAMNSAGVVTPLYQLPFSQWWFHSVNGCLDDPPPAGEFLEIPAGGSFSVELASNRGKTSLSFDGQYTSEWPDGETYPEDYHVDTCITSPNLHTQNRQNAAGTAFAISYESDVSRVTPDNLVVFSVRYHTPWKRVTWYDVPAAMPACPEDGCICAWGWVPNGCGQPNMYHQAFKCKVTGATSITPVSRPRPPVWCEGNEGGCTQGAKQMIYWNQADGNNIQVSGMDASGQPKSPAYNMKLGFRDGAQNDIFDGAPSSSSPSSGDPAPSTPDSSPAPQSGSDSGGESSYDGGISPPSLPSSDGASSGPLATSPQCIKKRSRRALTRGRTSASKRALIAHKRMHLRDFSHAAAAH